MFFRVFHIEPLQASKSNIPLITACLVISSLYLEFSNFRGREGEDYHSHNTTQLDIEEMKKLLLKLPQIRKEVAGL